jgi:ATP-dependent helicase/DNAse subunit B
MYGGQVAAQGQLYGLPLALHYGEPLIHNPAFFALLDQLDLHAGDFRRRDLLDTLRSPYFAVPGLDLAQVDLLDQASSEMQVTGGRSAWLEAIRLIALPPVEVDGDGASLPQLETPLVAQLEQSLADFFAAVTPPVSGTVETYVDWLDRLIGQDLVDPDESPELETEADAVVYSLNMPAQIRLDADAPIIARDLAAMQQFKQAMRGLLSAQALAASINYQHEIDWNTFSRDLRITVENTTLGRGTARDGRVLVTTVTDARGLPHRHLFILGLSEGLFPQPAPEDPLLLDSERERLRAKGISLSTQAERAGDDGLFYGLIGQARDSLTLSRPHSKDGEIWAASHLWNATLAAFRDAQVEHLALGDVPSDPATRQEMALAVAGVLADGKIPVLDGIDPVYWERICRGRAIEMQRISQEAHNRYSGRLENADLIARVAALLNTDRVWSASQLNDYGLCSFRYFAARLLRLKVLEEPEDGMDVRQIGTLYHRILELTYRELAQSSGGAITPERTEEAVAVLHKVAAQQMESAPKELRFRASPQWAQEQGVLLRRLEKLIRADFSGENPLNKLFDSLPRVIYRQEAPFREGKVSIDLGGERLRVNGSIDRLDRQGDRVIVVDYKSGSTLIKSDEIASGRNFQMMVYLLAAQALIEADESPDAPREVAGGVFWKIGGEALGSLHAVEDAEVIEAGKDHLRRYLDRARSGDFAAHANKLDGGKCAHYCDFHQFCRVNIIHQRKP